MQRMTLLLKQLDIHGFKSFATPTTFAFDRGITAIIGPNGSGKSNVAEALRWVLGEQANASLRSRRTEDVIFAGSDKRAQLSMAEVTLTLDNSDGDLPLPFSEISVARRAFRAGENQYLINGARARLKDVQQLVAPLGQSHTIIGQGLVDAALSQRPDERRALFEHAAGISGLRLRANDAERSLVETAANAQRLRDILGELEPRVRSLERQAKLAREYGGVRDQLARLQRQRLAALWRESRAKQDVALNALEEAERLHKALDREHTTIARSLAQARGEERRVGERARQEAETLAGHERDGAEQRHRRDLIESRARATADRLADLRELCQDLERERDTTSAESARLSEESRLLEVEAAVHEQRLAEHNARMVETRRQRDEARQRLAEAERRLAELSRSIAEREGSLSVLADRRSGLDSDARRLDDEIAGVTQRVQELSASAANARASQNAKTVDIARVAQERAGVDERLVCCRSRMAGSQSAIDAVEREIASLRARHELLERARASGEGLHAGVRALLRAVRRGELALPGLVGALAETVETPPDYETAIEVALGGHMQDIIVERWDDARTAIEFLKRTNAGRVTFQPLDSVRPPSQLTLDARDRDLLGVAADLVAYPTRIASVVRQALGRTLVVTDLVASRRISASARNWTIVTLAGEITRPSGSVTGGARVTEAGLLARERERRALPAILATRELDRKSLGAELDAIAEELARLSERRDELQRDFEALRSALADAQSELERAEREMRDLEATQASHLRQRESHVARAKEIDDLEDATRAKLATLAKQRAETLATHDDLAGTLASGPDEIDDDLAQLRAEIATARERQRGALIAARQARQRAAAAEESLAARTQEIERLEASMAAAKAERTTVEAEIERLESLIEQNRAALPPLEQERGALLQSLASMERDLDRATEDVREAERERDRASLGLSRVHDEQVFLLERARNDLGLTDPSSLEIDDNQDSAPASEEDIARLRERLRRMSVVSDDVLEQFEAESARLEFLTRQLADIDEATAGLRKVLTELNARMTRAFDTTFREVAANFEETFTRLFGGGTAKLVMSDPGDGALNIDIVAQPPGKRLQNLNALSGGERALTAVALLIAIQRSNPSPFCLLDEVDAALDESNVVRFRDEIRDLADVTQFVVITHNRGTIEGADTLFGVTMGDDGISRVLSLRLDEAIRTVEEYDTARIAGG